MCSTWAITGLANTGTKQTIDFFASKWENIGSDTKQIVVTGLSSNAKNAEMFADAILAGSFKGITGDDLESIFSILGMKHAKTEQILTEIPGLLGTVFESKGKRANILSNLNIQGPFTIESWVKFNGNIDNGDQLFSCGNKKAKPQLFQCETSFLRRRNYLVGKQKLQPNVWTHISFTRNKQGILKLYIDGELDATGKKWAGPLLKLQVLKSVENKGNDMQMLTLEFGIMTGSLL